MCRAGLLEFRREGVYCPLGGFYIDPWRSVSSAVITHGHADHARAGHGTYIAHHLTVPILRLRLGGGIDACGFSYGERFRLGDVEVSLHPAGHIPGSAQVRVEHRGEVWVVGGDYKLHDDGLSTPWEPVRCHTFVTESTFGLPVYRWPAEELVRSEMHSWWEMNRREGRLSVITAYSLGKAQRVMAMMNDGNGKIFVHSAIHGINAAYRRAGLGLPELPALEGADRAALDGSMVIISPAAFKERARGMLRGASVGHASGWMAVRGSRRRLGVDRGFVLSDHADWTGLNAAVRATGAERVFVTHGQVEVLVRWLREQGLDAHPVRAKYSGDGEGGAGT